MAEQGNIPPIPPDLRLIAQPYLEGEKLPDRILSLILRVAMREAEVTRLNALIDTADYSDGALIWKSDHEKIVAKEVAQLKAELEKRESLLDKFCASNDRLLAENERLKAPVMLPERYKFGMDASCAMAVDALLTARTGGIKWTVTN